MPRAQEMHLDVVGMGRDDLQRARCLGAHCSPTFLRNDRARARHFAAATFLCSDLSLQRHCSAATWLARATLLSRATPQFATWLSRVHHDLVPGKGPAHSRNSALRAHLRLSGG